jgi:DNA primase
MALHLFQTSPPTFSTQVITRKGQRMTLLSQKDLHDPQMHGEWIRAYCPIHGSDHQRSLSINPTTGFGVCFCCQTNVLVKEFNPEAAATLFRQAYGEHPSRCDPPSSLKRGPSSDCQSSPMALVPKAWQEREGQVLRQLYAQGALSLRRSEAWGAQAYLEARAIPVEIAMTTGVGYLEAKAAATYGEKLLERWEDRLLFPLLIFDQQQQQTAAFGFAGRLLSGWQSCADELAHKALLDQQGLRRWLKTFPAGWFWTPPQASAKVHPLILVEGPFDRLSLLAAGFEAVEVATLVGTALGMPLPMDSLSSVLLALDSDPGGEEASVRLHEQLKSQRISSERCLRSHVGGKDWNERWRRYGADGLDALYSHQALMAQLIS